MSDEKKSVIIEKIRWGKLYRDASLLINICCRIVSCDASLLINIRCGIVVFELLSSQLWSNRPTLLRKATEDPGWSHRSSVQRGGVCVCVLMNRVPGTLPLCGELCVYQFVRVGTRLWLQSLSSFCETEEHWDARIWVWISELGPLLNSAPEPFTLGGLSSTFSLLCPKPWLVTALRALNLGVHLSLMSAMLSLKVKLLWNIMTFMIFHRIVSCSVLLLINIFFQNCELWCFNFD